MSTPLLIAIFLALYLINFVLDFWLSHLNIKHLLQHKQAPPAPFPEYIDQERYQKSIAYSTSYHRFGLVSSTISAVVFLLFVYSGLFNRLDLLLRNHIVDDIWRGIGFFIALFFLQFFIGIPFSLYANFIIEEKFGFNRQTPGLWVKDQIKSLVLSLVLMLPLSYAVLYFVKYTGAYWWLYAWSLFFLYGLTLSMIYPVFIAPLFNKFTPLAEGELRELLENMAQRAKFPMENVNVMDASKRSTHANAYFAGLGKTKRLVLYDSLVTNFSPEQIASVVAHEIGHFRKKHIWKHLVLSQATALLFFFLLSVAIDHPYLYRTFLVDNFSQYMGILLLGIVISLVFDFFSPLFNLVSWKFESEADRYALELTENKDAIKTMLIKLAVQNLSNLTPHPIYARFNYSHPPILTRLHNLGLVEKL